MRAPLLSVKAVSRDFDVSRPWLDRIVEGGGPRAGCMRAPWLSVKAVSRDFDVSRPWLDRMLEGEGRRLLRAVDGVTLEVRHGETLVLVGGAGCGKAAIA